MVYKFFIMILALLSAGCNQEKLSVEEQKKLNNLNANETVQAYFSSGNPEIELYLSSDKERERRNLPNMVQDNERIDGVDSLLIAETSDSSNKNSRLFIVKYNSQRRN